MTAQQGHPESQQPEQAGQEGGLAHERGSAQGAGSPGTTEVAAGIPQQAGRPEESSETPIEDIGSPDKAGSSADDTDPADVAAPDEPIEEHPEDQNSG